MGTLSVVTIDASLLSLRSTVLRQQAVAVPLEDSNALSVCESLSVAMFEVMYEHDGAALAAPQVGVSLRLIVMDPAGLKFGPHVFINPTIESKSESELEGVEGCLSLPRHTGIVSRAGEIIVQAYDLRGELREYRERGWIARILQHEIDHLDGFLYPDRLRDGHELVEAGTTAHRRAIASMQKLSTTDNLASE